MDDQGVAEMKYDFYFSAKHEAHLNMLFQCTCERGYHNEFKGQRYTEMIQQGKDPVTAPIFDDLVFLGTGTDEDCKYFRH